MQTFRRLTALLLTLVAWTAQAQVTTSPVFFTDTTPVTITYDASQGNGALNNFTGNVYIWTGTVTNLSSSNTNWRNVHSPTFGVADPTALMTRDASNPNIYRITFTPRTYYPIPAAETLQRLGMIFKNADGSVVGRATGGGDIFVDAASAALSARITSPTPNASGNPLFVNLGAQISVTGTASATANLAFSLNGTQVASQASATTLTTTVTAASGRNVVRFTAASGTSTAVDSLIFVVRPAVTTAALPAGAKDGVTYLNGGTSVILNLTAPNKQFAYVLGEFNNWQTTTAGYMNKTPDGSRWWVQINGLTPGREYAYQYLVDGNLRVADPYCEKILDPNDDQYIPARTYPNLKAYPAGLTTGIVSVLQTNQTPYVWTATNFQRPSRTNLVVYELLMRDFTAFHDYQTVRDTLNYLSRLGVNAIELMPINEFDGNDNWGYSPDFFFAPDKYYGTKQAFKQFIDECHRRGIAVIMDMVLNHATGQSPMVQLYGSTAGPSADNPWFNVTAPHPYSVYNDFNHESALTKYFSKQVMSFWLQEYHIDGYRFDLAGGFTQQTSNGNTYGNYDQSRINIWMDYYQHMIGVDANLYPILEHFPENREAKALADAGFMIWGNAVNNYNEATMGYLPGSNFSYGYYGSTAQGGRGWNSPNLVTYMESHDEERLMYKNLTFGNSNGTYSTRDLNTALARIELASAFFFTVPGPKMVWQFGELGYDKSIFMCSNGTVPTPYPNDQCKLSAKPPVWSYYQDANRRQLYEVQRALIALKKQEPAFANPTSYTQQLAGAAKSIHVSNATQNVTVIGNFDVTTTTIDPAFQRTGKWYNYLSGDSITVTNANALITLAPGAYAVYTTRRLKKATLLGSKASRTEALRLAAVPNPSSSSASLRYELAMPASVTVTVHNVLGATVRTISSRATQAAGAHELTLPVQDLANGIYVVRLSTGQLMQTTRLVVQH
ncbi:MAG: 1,4-alpha-glucan-branching protein [Hymenobacter sp.]|nr:1,4-alpha-glucan-branching protein [Hymenobacter sp.]